MLMLLKYQCKLMTDYIICLSLIATALLLSNSAYSEEHGNDALQIHGFLAQGLIRSEGSNFVRDDNKISTELTEIGINTSFQLNHIIRLTGQMVYLDGGNRYVKGPRVDYALAELSLYSDNHWLVHLYLGRFKNNNWLYSSTRDVPHARPSIILPQSVYYDGFRDVAMGSDGAALKVNYSSDDYGDFDLHFNYGTTTLDTKDVKLLLGDNVLGTGKQKFDAQTSFYWRPNMSPWQFGVSILDSDFNYKRAQKDVFTDAYFSFQQYTGNILYEGEMWQFSTEFFQQSFIQKGFYSKTFDTERVGQGAFFQSEYQYNQKLSLLARIERFYMDKNDKNGSKLQATTGGYVPSYFGYQHDYTLGASYDLADSWRMQIEYHWVKGTARLTPVVSPNLAVNNSEKWDMWAIQFMYWF